MSGVAFSWRLRPPAESETLFGTPWSDVDWTTFAVEGVWGRMDVRFDDHTLRSKGPTLPLAFLVDLSTFFDTGRGDSPFPVAFPAEEHRVRAVLRRSQDDVRVTDRAGERLAVLPADALRASLADALGAVWEEACSLCPGLDANEHVRAHVASAQRQAAGRRPDR